MRKILSASFLVLTLCAPAFAGDVPMPPLPQPPLRSRTAAVQPADGDALTAEADSLPETLLSVIESVIALF